MLSIWFWEQWQDFTLEANDTVPWVLFQQEERAWNLKFVHILQSLGKCFLPIGIKQRSDHWNYIEQAQYIQCKYCLDKIR